jgi:alkanesulfonate monooxygenase SsuD/methylene tetrahydromethanopterin reductase-like flavin-dependent oxidoreductase (luciferase family)
MSRTVTIELSDPVYEKLRRAAEAAGRSPADQLRAEVECQYGVAAGGVDAPALTPAERLRAAIIRDHGPRAVSQRPTGAEDEATRGLLRRHFGAVRSGRPCSDNDQIDADLAREYGNNHEGG